MNTRTLAIAALVLWLVTFAVVAVFFVRGSTVQGSDNRTAVVLAPAERDVVLAEMRGLLVSVQGVLEGLNKGDMKQVAEAASASGMGAAVDLNPALMAKLPLEFKSLGMTVHHAMDDLATAAKTGKPAAEIQGMLSATLGNCIACHSAWQLKAGN